MDEATGRDLLEVEPAWPMARRLASRQGFSTGRLGLYDRLARKDLFCVFVAHGFQSDRLSDVIEERTRFDETYAATVRVMTDHQLPSDVLEAIQHDHMPQFNLRNIGRAERNVELDDPLPLERRSALSRTGFDEVEEARRARIEPPRLAEIWTVAYVDRMRRSLRRLLIEDPWEAKYGVEVFADFAGQPWRFIVEGTHPDDQEGNSWGPETIPEPESWQSAPSGTRTMERPALLQDMITVLREG